MTQTIDITPIINRRTIQEYAEKHQTDQPWQHASGQLTALSALNEQLDQIEDEMLQPEEAALEFVARFQQMHREVSTQFARFFGTDQ